MTYRFTSVAMTLTDFQGHEFIAGLLSEFFRTVVPQLTSFKLIQRAVHYLSSGAVLGKNIWGAWPLIIWEATTAKRIYYGTDYIKHLEKLGLNYPEKKIFFGGGERRGLSLSKIWGEAMPHGPNVEPPLSVVLHMSPTCRTDIGSCAPCLPINRSTFCSSVALRSDVMPFLSLEVKY